MLYEKRHSAYKSLYGQPEGTRPPGKRESRRKNNRNLKFKIGSEAAKQIILALNGVQCRDL